MHGLDQLMNVLRRVLSEISLPRGSYIVLFGSVAEGRDNLLSDIDLAVKGLGVDEASRIAELIESHTGRRVDIVLVEKAMLPLLYEALVRGVFIAGDREAYVEDKWKTLMLWLDFEEIYRSTHNSYLKQVLSINNTWREVRELRPGISRRVDRVLKAIQRLDKLASMGIEEIYSKDLLPILEREVEVIIQGLLDIGGYIISVKGWDPPSTYGEIGPILAKHGVLNEEEGRVLKSLAGLRNIIVHVYADIDYEQLFKHAYRLRFNARTILSKITRYIRREGIDP